MHPVQPLLLVAGVLWFVFWTWLSLIAWMADAGQERDIADWAALVIVAAFILIPSVGFFLTGLGYSLGS